MTETEARERCADFVGSRMPMLEHYVAALLDENVRQNLIAQSTETAVWRRHILDSLQLARYARDTDRTWLDVGSGPGLPGLVLAILGPWRLTLVEPRRLRAEFMRRVVSDLGLAADVVQSGVETVSQHHNLITARAVTTIDRLFALTSSCFDLTSRFVIPKGRSAHEDVDGARIRWHGVFHVEQSLTDPEAGIVIADGVAAR